MTIHLAHSDINFSAFDINYSFDAIDYTTEDINYTTDDIDFARCIIELKYLQYRVRRRCQCVVRPLGGARYLPPPFAF